MPPPSCLPPPPPAKPHAPTRIHSHARLPPPPPAKPHAPTRIHSHVRSRLPPAQICFPFPHARDGRLAAALAAAPRPHAARAPWLMRISCFGPDDGVPVDTREPAASVLVLRGAAAEAPGAPSGGGGGPGSGGGGVSAQGALEAWARGGGARLHAAAVTAPLPIPVTFPAALAPAFGPDGRPARGFHTAWLRAADYVEDPRGEVPHAAAALARAAAGREGAPSLRSLSRAFDAGARGRAAAAALRDGALEEGDLREARAALAALADSYEHM